MTLNKHNYKANCDYCGKEYTPKRKAQRFCCVKCRVYGNRWEKGESKIPFKTALNTDVTHLLSISKEVNKHFFNGNYIAEIVTKKIELGHFSLISNSEIKYLEKAWGILQNKHPNTLTEDELSKILNNVVRNWVKNHKK